MWYLGHLTSDAISTIDDLSTGQESSLSDSSSEADAHSQEQFQQRLKQVIEGFNNKKRTLRADDAQAIENALYFAEKYMSKRVCKNSKRSYIAGLIKDIDKAKYEFSETCYDNDYASDVFQQLKLHLAGMLTDKD
jgi:acetylornithine/succinyldiaminopimelate/putrescine aminotransferase